MERRLPHRPPACRQHPRPRCLPLRPCHRHPRRSHLCISLKASIPWKATTWARDAVMSSRVRMGAESGSFSAPQGKARPSSVRRSADNSSTYTVSYNEKTRWPRSAGRTPFYRAYPGLRGVPRSAGRTPVCGAYPGLRDVPRSAGRTPVCGTYPGLRGVPRSAGRTPFYRAYPAPQDAGVRPIGH